MKDQLLEIIELMSNENTFNLGINLFEKTIDKSLYKNYEVYPSTHFGFYIKIYFNDNSLFRNTIKEIGDLSDKKGNYCFCYEDSLMNDYLIIYEKEIW